MQKVVQGKVETQSLKPNITKHTQAPKGAWAYAVVQKKIVSRG